MIEREKRDTVPLTPCLWYCPESDSYKFTGETRCQKTEIERIRIPRHVTGSVLADIIYLARRFPWLLVDPRLNELGDVLRMQSHGQILLSLFDPKIRVRLEFALLKLMLSTNFLPTNDDVKRLVGDGLLRALAQQSEYPMLAHLFSFYLEARPRTFHAIALPRKTRQGWRGRLVHFSDHEYNIQALETAGWSGLQTWLETDLKSRLVREIPVARLRCGQPPEPGCCRYRDFSKGVAEIVWYMPELERPTGLSSLVPLILPSEDEFLLGHAHGAVGRAANARLDFNFLSIVAGRTGEVVVVATKRG